MHKSRYLRLNIVKHIHLYPSLILAELNPLEDYQRQVDGGGVESIDMTLNLEDLVYSASSAQLNHIVGELLEDVVIRLFVSLAKIASHYRLADA